MFLPVSEKRFCPCAKTAIIVMDDDLPPWGRDRKGKNHQHNDTSDEWIEREDVMFMPDGGFAMLRVLGQFVVYMFSLSVLVGAEFSYEMLACC